MEGGSWRHGVCYALSRMITAEAPKELGVGVQKGDWRKKKKGQN